ncbi:MAG: hypothetical protein R6V74_07035 [Lutibacter sp.]
MESVQYLFDYFENAPAIIQVVWVTSCLLFVSILILTVNLKYLRGHLRRNEKTIAEYQKEYESDLITYLYAGNQEDEISAEQQVIIDKLKNCSADRFKRRIIVSTLLRLRNEISGEMAESIQKLYFQTKLVDYALARLKRKKWHIIATAIRELRQLQVKEVYNEVIAFVNHPKKEIQKEVQLYLVTLFNFKGLEFLNIIETPLSEWNQIQLLEVLQRFDDQELPEITPWLRSTNDSVVIFALKLAKIYNQFEVKDTLLELLSHQNKNIRIDVINVLAQLQVIEAKNILKNKFNDLSKEEQYAFLKLLENLYEISDEAFLLENIINEDFEVKFVTLKILKILNVEKFKTLKTISTDPAYVKIFNFLEIGQV